MSSLLTDEIRLREYLELIRLMVHGPVGEYVTTDAGQVPSFATAMEIITGFMASSSSNAILNTGTHNFDIGLGKKFAVGQWVVAQSESGYLFGQVESYTAGVLEVNVTVVEGSGAASAWEIVLTAPAGPQGIQGEQGPIGPQGIEGSLTQSAMDASQAAIDASVEAQLAANANLAQGRYFTTVEFGLAGSTDGQSFSTKSADGKFLVVYQRQAGVAVEQLRLASQIYLDLGLDFSNYGRSGYVGGIVDSAKRIALGIRKSGAIDIGHVEDIAAKITQNLSITTGPATGGSSVVSTGGGSARTNPRLTADVVALETSTSNTSLVKRRGPLAWTWIDSNDKIAGGLDYSGNLWSKGLNVTSIVGQINTVGLSNITAAAGLTAVVQTSNSYARSGYAWAVMGNSGRVALGLDMAGNLISKGKNLNARLDTLEASQGVSPTYDKEINGYANYAGWGDSLTAGAGGNGTTYLSVLSSLSGKTAYNGGVGGQSSSDIATRQGGFVTMLTVTGNTIPASGGVAVTTTTRTPITSQGGNNIPGKLAGVAGVLSATFDGNGVRTSMTFTRSAAGSAVVIDPATPFIPDTLDRDYLITVFWYGRNNFPTGVSDFAAAKQNVKDALAASIAFLKPLNKKFVILGVINRNIAAEYIGQPVHQAIVELNEELKALYPRNFIDIRRVLVRAYNPSLPQDVIDNGNDVLPTSLTADGLHLNAAGYTLVGQTVYNFTQQKGW